MAIKIGSSIGRYRILKPLGQGGMASVYKALDSNLDALVALKFIRMDDLPAAQVGRTIKRFRIEARKMAQLSHANIVQVSDFGEYQGMPYLVMPYLPGGTLKDWIGNPMHWMQVFTLAIPLAEALAYTHRQGIIHRDIKPANILLTESGQPMLSDFGIAKIVDQGEVGNLTATGVSIGTPEYMAPEQYTSNQFDNRVDIYALGIILYELVTGRKPFLADTPLAVLIKHARDPLPPPASFVPGLPPSVEGVLVNALAKNPDDRFGDMDEMMLALRQCLKEEKGAGETGGFVPQGLQVQHPKQDAVNTDQKPRRPSPQRELPALPWKPVILGAGLVLVVALVVLGIPAAARPAGSLRNQGEGVPSAPAATLPAPAVMQPTPTIMIQMAQADGMVMVYIPAGEFQMGSESGRDNERPVHPVNLDAYWIDKTEVTNAMFARYVKETAYRTGAEVNGKSNVLIGSEWVEINGATWQHPRKRSDNIQGMDEYPVVHVTWIDAQNYCRWAGRRLPTEAEWEKAARGTDGRAYPWGDAPLETDEEVQTGDEGLYGGFQFLAPAGSFPDTISPYGVTDMAGNVWEWVADWYNENFYSRSPDENPTGPASGQYRVLRGGSWVFTGKNIRASDRGKGDPFSPYSRVGFRCAMDAE